ncbi:hypothetical protein SPRG_04269 [Saprolegnia parasitica CBS 223.65]|uniref:Zinc finger PHD-type domain-containing protein n=1 Tax=Saprolegnia parasitica (strain CBS 223.65) TaxID=695850 RepID=A0A067CPG5_SAPPC|nr:hypothetical protein SPRG_04269 [Saprolegnia parasitica CBS 223.65]KDO31130.1 hypothetical protein SPRG_04269 [Saprolegnia parasitica CBS 223.65]|eukprot:XP_012198259.1 hypothetical protein SPRG_04269 [Saprolegnia parasitica CBS 223.65]
MSTDVTGVMRTLISAQLLQPGPRKLYVSYYRSKAYADLLPDGGMLFEGQRFVNPSAVAVAMKRSLNPGMKTRHDPGWASLYASDTGDCLKDLRDQIIPKHSAATSTSAARSRAAEVTPDPPARSRVVEAPPAPRELCAICSRDRGSLDLCVKCEACAAVHHKACVDKNNTTTTAAAYYCTKCIDHHCSLVQSLLRDLRQVVVQYGGVSSEAVADTEPAAIAETSSVTSPRIKDEEETKEIEMTAAASSSSLMALGASDDVVDLDALAADVPPATATSLLAQIDGMLKRLNANDQRMQLLLNSTGEVLVHLASLDMAKALHAIDDDLKKVATTCTRDNDANADHFSPGVDGLVHVLNLRHGILSARYHFQRTVTALQTLSEKRLRSCDIREAKTSDAWQKELRIYNEWVAKMASAKASVAAIQHEIAQKNALIDNAVRHRKTLRAISLSKRFIPAYRECTQGLQGNADYLLVTILADKLKGLAQSIKKWESMGAHYTDMKRVLLARKDSLKRKRDDDDDDDDALLPALKLTKRDVTLPSPPLAKLIDRQVLEMDTNLGNIESHKKDALGTLGAIEKALDAHQHATESLPEWTALLGTVRDLMRRCEPPREEPATPEVVDEPQAIEDAVGATHDDGADTEDEETDDANHSAAPVIAAEPPVVPAETAVVKTEALAVQAEAPAVQATPLADPAPAPVVHSSMPFIKPEVPAFEPHSAATYAPQWPAATSQHSEPSEFALKQEMLAAVPAPAHDIIVIDDSD